MKKNIFLIAVILLISACGGTQTQIGSYKFTDQNISASKPALQNSENEEVVEDWAYCGDLPLNRREYEDCLENELKKLEKSLDKDYSAALKRMQESWTKKDVVNLTKAQKNWNLYREANCLAEKETYGEGTDAVGASLHCYLRLTKERRIEIEGIYAPK